MDDSLAKGPQIISRRGKPTTVMISYDDYRRQFPTKTVTEALMAADLSGIDLSRDRSDTGRATPVDFNDIDI